jgi:hypothetical protein
MSSFIRPTNQKGVYHNFAMVLEKLENGDITVEKAEAMTNALNGMNRVQALEIKRAEVTKSTLRIVESKNFENKTDNQE